MTSNKLFTFLLVVLLYPSFTSIAQNPYKVHAHNDYQQAFPFWHAYTSGAASIEVDIYLQNDQLYVTHEKTAIQTAHTLQKLYLNPLDGLAATGDLRNIQLLVDIKSEAYSTLTKLVATLQHDYPNLLKKEGVHIVISGNRPKPKDYSNYPDFIAFDHQNVEDLDSINLEKVALVSLSFKDYSQWNGYGRMVAADMTRVKQVIKQVKQHGKPFRFWATPDTKSAWGRLAALGVDYLNTDKPAAAVAYLDKLDDNTYQAAKPIAVYPPTYAFDPEATPQNIILMIGDGNGLAQITAAMVANRGSLNLTQIKDIGLVDTHSADDLITDSAAGATAMATGQKTDNRAIGVNPAGNNLPTLIELLGAKGFHTAIVTTDAIYGATPSAFYAHRSERDDTDGLLTDLNHSNLNFFIAGGQGAYAKTAARFPQKQADEATAITAPFAMYLGENKAPTIQAGRKDLLPQSVNKALAVLQEAPTPFFLLVEGAQIDNGGHENNIGKIINELLDFDQAIAAALRFADQSKNTLVIITADHETSGLGLVNGDLTTGTVQADFLTIDHTGILVPLFAYGPQSQQFNGVYENTAIFEKIMAVLKMK